MAAIESGSGGGSWADAVVAGPSVATSTATAASSSRTGLRISDLPRSRRTGFWSENAGFWRCCLDARFRAQVGFWLSSRVVALDAAALLDDPLLGRDDPLLGRDEPLARGDAAAAVRREAAPEQQRHQQPDHPGDHQDDPDGVDVEALGAHVHREGEDGPHHQQEDAGPDAHVIPLDSDVPLPGRAYPPFRR